MAVVVDDRLVEYVAELSKLTVPEEEKERFRKEFEAIVSYMNRLDDLDTEGVEPLSHTFPLTNVFREDREVPSSLSKQELLRNAPETKDGCFRVPKTVE